MDQPNVISNLLLSMVRTLVPAAVSGIVSWLATRWGVIVDEETQSGLLVLFSGLVFGVYYFVVRMLETYVAPKFSWFLGDFRKGMSAPVYAEATEAILVPPREPIGD